MQEKLKYLQLICWYKIVHISKDILATWRHFKIFLWVNTQDFFLSFKSVRFQKLKCSHIRVFAKVDHSGNDARIVLGQNQFSKKSYTLDPITVVFPVPCLSNCANSHCLKDWDFKDPYISDHSINSFFMKTALNHTFFKRSWHY